MKYINAIQGSLIALVIFALTAVFAPSNGPAADVELILTVSTFLFAILAGFFIARLNKRYDQLRDQTADEDSYMLSFYLTSQFFGKSFQRKIANIIDRIYVTSYDTFLADDYKYSKADYVKFYEALNEIKIKRKKENQAFDNMVTMLAEIEKTRNNTAIIAADKLTIGQWIIMIVLAAIITFCLFFLKVPEVYSQVITAMLSTILILVILMMRDLQNLRLMGTCIVTESGQEIFEDIGKIRYYNNEFVKNGFDVIPKNLKRYRLGFHEAGEKHNIKIITKK